MLNNQCLFIGRLTRDMEMSAGSGPNATVVGKFSLAIDNGKDAQGNKREATFVNLKIFGKSAETLNTYVCKGSLIAVSARYETGNYVKDGKKIYTHEFVVDPYSYQLLADTRQSKQGEQAANQEQQGGQYPPPPSQGYTPPQGQPNWNNQQNFAPQQGQPNWNNQQGNAPQQGQPNWNNQQGQPSWNGY